MIQKYISFQTKLNILFAFVCDYENADVPE